MRRSGVRALNILEVFSRLGNYRGTLGLTRRQMPVGGIVSLPDERSELQDVFSEGNSQMSRRKSGKV